MIQYRISKYKYQGIYSVRLPVLTHAAALSVKWPVTTAVYLWMRYASFYAGPSGRAV